MRIVIDPNVLVSAAIVDGVSAELIDRWLTDRPFEMVVCPALVDELREVLSRDKFCRWITVDEAVLFVDRLEHVAEPWSDPVDVPAVTGDPKDDYLVALCHESRVDTLISGDADLLTMDDSDVDAATPGTFLARLQ